MNTQDVSESIFLVKASELGGKIEYAQDLDWHHIMFPYFTLVKLHRDYDNNKVMLRAVPDGYFELRFKLYTHTLMWLYRAMFFYAYCKKQGANIGIVQQSFRVNIGKVLYFSAYFTPAYAGKPCKLSRAFLAIARKKIPDELFTFDKVIMKFPSLHLSEEETIWRIPISRPTESI